MEKELYDFALRQFDYLRQRCLDLDGNLLPARLRFRYEKVYGPRGAIVP